MNLTVIGILSWLWYQAFINRGMAIRTLPITDVPPPFISYGGSSLLANFIGIGIILSISRSRY